MVTFGILNMRTLFGHYEADSFSLVFLKQVRSNPIKTNGFMLMKNQCKREEN